VIRAIKDQQETLELRVLQVHRVKEDPRAIKVIPERLAQLDRLVPQVRLVLKVMLDLKVQLVLLALKVIRAYKAFKAKLGLLVQPDLKAKQERQVLLGLKDQQAKQDQLEQQE
jgi:hypothetical protein